MIASVIGHVREGRGVHWWLLSEGDTQVVTCTIAFEAQTKRPDTAGISVYNLRGVLALGQDFSKRQIML